MIASHKLTIAYIDLDDIRNPLLGAGQATATYQVGKRLAARGHRVIVLCSKYPGYKDRTEEGIEYRHIGINTPNIKVNNLLFFFFAPWAVWRLRKVDIILECFTAPLSVLLSPLFTSIPVIAIPSMFNAKEFAQKYHLPFHRYEAWGLKFYQYIMPYSETDREKALSMNPHLITRTITQGVGDEYREIQKKKAKHILFLGRFDMAQKGIDLLLEAYAKVQDGIAYPLVIAGHGPDEAQIRKIIREKKLENSVRIVGSAYGKKKMELMSEAAFVAFPSRHDEICLWTLEALAAGLPMVAFDIPESQWLTEKVALKAKPFDTDNYAQKLVDASDATRNTRMSQASRELAQKYSWESVVERMEDFMFHILKTRKA